MTIWKQGPFYPDRGKKIVEFPYTINRGPSDSMIVIDGYDVLPGANGDFPENNDEKPYSEGELNAIHTFAVMRMTIDLFGKLSGKPILWSWQQQGDMSPLRVCIDNNDINARYLKKQKCIELDYYGPPENPVYNCRTTDLVVHETAHAILDSLKPAWEIGDLETKGVAEAFCDLAAMFWILCQKDLCTDIIRETNGDLLKDNTLSIFGAGHGFDENPWRCIRNALNAKTYEKNAQNPYDHSEVLTGFLYDLLLLLFNEKKDDFDEPDALYYAARPWMNLIFNAYRHAPDSQVCIGDITGYLKGHFDTKAVRYLLTKRNL